MGNSFNLCSEFAEMHIDHAKFFVNSHRTLHNTHASDIYK